MSRRLILESISFFTCGGLNQKIDLNGGKYVWLLVAEQCRDKWRILSFKSGQPQSFRILNRILSCGIQKCWYRVNVVGIVKHPYCAVMVRLKFFYNARTEIDYTFNIRICCNGTKCFPVLLCIMYTENAHLKGVNPDVSTLQHYTCFKIRLQIRIKTINTTITYITIR